MTKSPVLLNGNLQEVKRLNPYDGSVSLNIIPLSTASLTLSVNEGVKRGDWIEMFTERGTAGIFRVRSVSDEYNDDITTVEMDHAVSEVGDYVVKEKINKSTTLSDALNSIFSNYKGDRWTLSAGNHSETVVVDANNENVLEAMLSVLEQTPEYYLTFDFSSSKWVIGLAQRETVFTAEGRLSRNIQSASVTYDDSELYTRVYIEYGDAGETKTKHYDASTAKKNKYGIREYFMSQSGYTEQQAQTAAMAYLNSHSSPSVAVSISGYDLTTITFEPLDTFEIGKLYRLAIPQHGVVVEENITSLEWSSVYGDPSNVRISLADVEDPVVSFMKQTKKSGGGTRKQLDRTEQRFYKYIIDTQSYFEQKMVDLEDDLGSRIVQTASEIRSEVWAAKSSLYSAIVQTATYIMMTVASVQSGLHAQIEITASQIRAEVSAANSELYSVIQQTATNILMTVASVQSGLQASIEVTASSIRTEVNAANSTIFSSIMQTATNIYTQVGNAKSGLYSNIEQTANSIRSEVSAANSTIFSSIMQTATNIYTQVGNAKSGIYSNIEQTASSIRSEVVGKNGVISAINQTAEQITISASKVNLQGYVTSSMLESAFTSAQQMATQQMTISNYFTCLGYNVEWKTYAARKCSLGGEHTFKDTSGDNYTGRLVTAYSDTTIYYLGR